MKIQIKVFKYKSNNHTWYEWLLKRSGKGGKPIARSTKPFTGAYIANKSANKMADLMREAGCEVEVIEAVYEKPAKGEMKRSKRPTKINCKGMEKFGVSLC